MLHFLKLDSKQNDLFEPPSPQKNNSESKVSLNFLLHPVCHLPVRIDEDRLSGLGDIASKKKEKITKSLT